MLPGRRHRGLTTMQTLFTCFLNWESGREHEEFMVLRVKPTPTRFPTSGLCAPNDNTLLQSTGWQTHSVVYMV